MQQIERLRFSRSIGMNDAMIAAVTYRLQVPLYTHAALERFGLSDLETGRVDDLEFEIHQPRVAHAAVAGHARPVVDEGKTAPDEAIEQGRFSDIRSTDDGDGDHVEWVPSGCLERSGSVAGRLWGCWRATRCGIGGLVAGVARSRLGSLGRSIRRRVRALGGRRRRAT